MKYRKRGRNDKVLWKGFVNTEGRGNARITIEVCLSAEKVDI